MTASGETRESGSTAGAGRVATWSSRRASAARASPTFTSPWKRTRSPRRWTRRTSRRSWSPGTTGRRNFVSSKPTTRISSARGSGAAFSRKIPAAWASDSRMRTPGITGCPGKWPAKKSSAPVTFLKATSRPSRSCSTMRSTRTNGYWVGSCLTSRPISPELMRGRRGSLPGRTRAAPAPRAGAAATASGRASERPAPGSLPRARPWTPPPERRRRPWRSPRR